MTPVLSNTVKGIIFVGLDIESTGTNPNIHELIQIGVQPLDLRAEGFKSDIGHAHGKYFHSDEALAVNKFTHERIIGGPDANTVDTALYHYLVNRFQMTKTKNGNWKDRLVPVGWNVGSFDMPFVVKTLPKTSDLFSYRALDLNSVVFDHCVAMGVNKLEKIKDKAKKYATKVLEGMGIPENWHDALYDAQASIAAWEYLNEMTAKTYRALDAMKLHADIIYGQ